MGYIFFFCYYNLLVIHNVKFISVNMSVVLFKHMVYM